MTKDFRNWSGSVHAQPRELVRPRTEAELAAIVARATGVRVVGAGHSFMPLCATQETLIDLRDLEGELEVSADRKRVWVPAGWSIAKLGPALWERGLSIANQGDVDPQSLAGAISTGTHGTGAELGSLSTFARAFRLMLEEGSIVECSREQEPELFEAQRLSLGLLGIAVAIELDVLPAYRLEERISVMPLGEVIERFSELAATHRHAEFFLFPYSDKVVLKTLHPTDDTGRFKAPSALEEKVFQLVCDATTFFPSIARPAQWVMLKLVSSSRRVGPAFQIFPSERSVRFEEMEYELPRAAGFAALQEVIAWIRREKHPVAFPFEFRWTAGDDIWLSPFNRGPGASVSVHQYAKLPWRELFASVEPIFRAHAGRPHWAKRHTLTTKDVFELYPKATRFCEVRAGWDRVAKFSNAHLRELFAIEPDSRSHAHAG
jgi:FAD-linked oxidoreductase